MKTTVIAIALLIGCGGGSGNSDEQGRGDFLVDDDDGLLTEYPCTKEAFAAGEVRISTQASCPSASSVGAADVGASVVSRVCDNTASGQSLVEWQGHAGCCETDVPPPAQATYMFWYQCQ